MPPKSAPYTGTCAACGEGGEVFNSRPTGRGLCLTDDDTNFDTHYPHFSTINNKQCTACYYLIEPQVKPTCTPTKKSIGTKKRRLSKLQEDKVKNDPTFSLAPAAGTRGLQDESEYDRKMRILLASQPHVDLRSDDNIIMREHTF